MRASRPRPSGVPPDGVSQRDDALETLLRDDLLRLFPRLRTLPADAYIVGGAVRDLIFGAAPADVDVACLDPLACARALGRNVIRLGREDHLSAWRVVDGPHVYDFAALLDRSIDADLARRGATQVRRFGTEIISPAKAKNHNVAGA